MRRTVSECEKGRQKEVSFRKVDYMKIRWTHQERGVGPYMQCVSVPEPDVIGVGASRLGLGSLTIYLHIDASTGILLWTMSHFQWLLIEVPIKVKSDNKRFFPKWHGQWFFTFQTLKNVSQTLLESLKYCTFLDVSEVNFRADKGWGLSSKYFRLERSDWGP